MKSTSLLSIAILLAVSLILTVPAHADTFNLPSFTLFGTQSVTINDSLDENTICISGNVGTGGTSPGDLLLDKCRVNGSLFLSASSVLSLGSHGAFSGSLVTGSQAGVGATMSAVSSALNGLSANQTISGDLASSMTFHNNSTTGGTAVIDITGNVNLNSNILTFVAANAADKFVVNIGGDFAFSQSTIILSGFSNPDQLIFNITDDCSSVAEINKSTSVFAGILLAPQCDIRVHNQLSFDGELFGENVTVDSAATLSSPLSTVPEPNTLLLLGTGLISFAGIFRKLLA